MNEPPIWLVNTLFGLMFAFEIVALVFGWAFAKAICDVIKEASAGPEKKHDT